MASVDTHDACPGPTGRSWPAMKSHHGTSVHVRQMRIAMRTERNNDLSFFDFTTIRTPATTPRFWHLLLSLFPCDPGRPPSLTFLSGCPFSRFA